MLPLSPFNIAKPLTMLELGACLKDAPKKSKIIAGGTDIVPNLKHGLYDIEHIISLQELEELKKISCQDRNVCIGSGVTLSELINHEKIREMAPALIQAASHSASPQIRNMATVGGNICLDTRCLYFNQSEFWRSALGYCLKKDGTVCHVVKTGKRCVAASSNDLATMLLAFKAKLTMWTLDTEREIELDDFYTANGIKNNQLQAHEVVTCVQFDVPPGMHGGFAKLRHRESIDFSLISVGISYVLDGGKIEDLRVVINALVAKPKVLSFPEYNGTLLEPNLIDEIARLSAIKCHPQTNICDDPQWRKAMIECYVKRAFDCSSNR